MYACQIYKHAATQIPNLEEDIAKGNFKPLKVGLYGLGVRGWLLYPKP
jgi:Zn-dependent M32 family carboxypeptidase